MSRINAGDDPRFAALYAATARDVLAYLLRRAATREDAADCLAETFLIAWDKRDKIPTDLEQARPWLFGVARNVNRRSRQRQSEAGAVTAALARELDGIRRPPADDGDPVTAALAQLTAIDREIIEMLAWDEIPPREVARILGLSPNVVRVRASRAREKMRALLAGTSAGDPAWSHPR